MYHCHRRSLQIYALLQSCLMKLDGMNKIKDTSFYVKLDGMLLYWLDYFHVNINSAIGLAWNLDNILVNVYKI